jgi:hypothetical protein
VTIKNHISLPVRHKKILIPLYFYLKPTRKKQVGYVACLGENRNGYRVVLGKIDGKRALGRPRH